MVGIRIELTDINDNALAVDKVLSMELSRDLDAVCDGLRVTVFSDTTFDELCGLKLFFDDNLVFNGYVDTQRESINENGYTCFIYARSSACLLTDSTSEPNNYYLPSVNALFCKNVEGMGFKNGLKNLCSNGYYQVDSGVSRYGAINNFVYALTGKSIMVTPLNELVLIEQDEELDLSGYPVISQKRVINRAQAVSEIKFKAYDDTNYKHHLVSKLMQKKSITNSIVKNVSRLPAWQKQRLVQNAMEKANESYYCFELVLDGFVDATLLNTVRLDTALSKNEVWCVRSIIHTLSQKGCQTKLLLYKKLDLEEFTYVDK